MSDIVRRLRLTPVLMKYDEMGYPQTDYEACKKYINNEGVKLMREAADEIERLRAERDEARREICRNEADLISLELGGAAIFAASVAKRRGWDCFKEVRDES